MALAIALVIGLIVALSGSSAPGMATVAYLAGAAGLSLVHERLRAEFTPSIALLASLLLAAGTSLSWFMVAAPALRVTAAFALLAGIVFSMHRWWRPVAAAPIAIALAAAAAAAALAASLVHFGLDTTPAGLTEILFSSSNGFLAWNPVAYIGVLGTVASIRRDWPSTLATLLALVVMALLASVPVSGALPRGAVLVPALALIAPGLALVLEHLRKRPMLAAAPIVAGVLLWNYLLMVQYTIGLIPKDEPVSFAAMVRQQADVHTRSPYFYPFAFPANIWFAWRAGLPVDRYDLLASERPSAAADLTFDRRIDKLLIEGWDAPGADDTGPSWWIGERRASLVVPVALPAGRGARVSVLARSRFEEPVVEAEVGLEINGHEIGRFLPSPTEPSEGRFDLPPEAVGRLLHPGYNRLTFVSHGVRRLDPSDPRPPGPIASRPGTRAWPVTIYRVRIEPAP